MSEPGKCQGCGCTEDAPCSPPCAWANAERTVCTACAGVPTFEENYTSAAFDGARIACVTASVLVDLDSRLTETERMILLESLTQARGILDAARQILRIDDPKSVHIVRPNEPSAIILAR